MTRRPLGSSITTGKRTRIFKRDKCICQYCGKMPIRVEFHRNWQGSIYIRLIDPDTWKCFEVDHVIPVSKGGKSEESNLKTSCSKCNSKKGNKIWPEKE